MAQSQESIESARVLWEETLTCGGHWSGVLRRGHALRLVDLAGGANLTAVFYNADERLERFNLPDTLKAQHTAHLTRGHVCYSDMGRVLCSIVSDSLGWHDPLGAPSTAESCAAKYGERRYQEFRNEMVRSTRDGLLIELAKWGLGQRDLVPGVNFFSKVVADESGRLHYAAAHSAPGSTVDLRFEMNSLVFVSAAPHTLDPGPHWNPKPVRLVAWRAEAPGDDDFCRNFRPENTRGFLNTEALFR